MAKARDIAALAGLAGLAYANRDKLFGGKKTYNEDAGDQKTSSYTKDTKKVAASDDRMSNEDYIKSRMKKDPADAESSMQSNMLSAITAPKAAPNDKASNQGVLSPKSLTATPKPKPKRTGMTGAQNTALANAGKQAKMASESDALAKVNTTAAKDEDARLGNIKAAKDYNRGQGMEREVLNNMITNPPMKKGGVVKKMASGGMTASRRADGIASRGKTKCKMY
jgi:hypothetical protein